MGVGASVESERKKKKKRGDRSHAIFLRLLCVSEGPVWISAFFLSLLLELSETEEGCEKECESTLASSREKKRKKKKGLTFACIMLFLRRGPPVSCPLYNFRTLATQPELVPRVFVNNNLENLIIFFIYLFFSFAKIKNFCPHSADEISFILIRSNKTLF